MNYLLLSLCFMLVGFPLVQASWWNLFAPKTCSDEVAKYLSEIKPDVTHSSIQELIKEARNLGISLRQLELSRHITFHAKDERELEQIGYPKLCDKILKHFSTIGEKKDCFTKESMDTIDDYEYLAEQYKLQEVIAAGFLCRYVLKWREEGGDEFARLFDFNQNKRDCIIETAASLSRVSLDESVEKVVKLTRDSDILFVDFKVGDHQRITDEYRRALLEIDAQEGCNNLFRQAKSSLAQVKCFAEEINGYTTAIYELSAMDKAGDISLASEACIYREKKCINEVASFLGKINLDNSAMDLVKKSRELDLTPVHYEADKYERLDEICYRELLKIGYPESCDEIEKGFSEIDEKVKCIGSRPFNMFSWMEVLDNTKSHAGDVVLARWACGFASKLEKKRLELMGINSNQPLEPVKMRESDEESKNHIIAAAELYRGIKLDSTVQEIVNELHACGITLVDFIVKKYRWLYKTCDRAFKIMDSKESCQELESKHVKPIKEKAEFYTKGLNDDPNNYFELMSQDGVGDILLADEACDYILKRK